MFKLQLVDDDGLVGRIPSGGPLERDFIAEAVKHIVSDRFITNITHGVLYKGVGFFKTQAQVEAALRDSLPNLLEEAIRRGLTEVVDTLKRDSRFAVK